MIENHCFFCTETWICDYGLGKDMSKYVHDTVQWGNVRQSAANYSFLHRNGGLRRAGSVFKAMAGQPPRSVFALTVWSAVCIEYSMGIEYSVHPMH